MQSITILKQVNIPNSPQFKKDTKIRVKDNLADILVQRGFAKYDEDKEMKTAKAKDSKQAKIQENKK